MLCSLISSTFVIEFNINGNDGFQPFKCLRFIQFMFFFYVDKLFWLDFGRISALI